jgi:mannose-6-phosphate isomerase-like protein (cupin superfamily)
MAIATHTSPEIFDLRTPYLEQGITSDMRSHTDMLSVLIKVYADGGENRMHNHPDEDHSFIVLEGEATFHLETDDNVRVVRPYEGVMLPKGASYWFHSSGEGNLVMLRVGAQLPGTPKRAIYPDGGLKAREHEPLGKVERKEKPGRGFGQ